MSSASAHGAKIAIGAGSMSVSRALAPNLLLIMRAERGIGAP
jgi:hypothetical protein